MFKTNILKQSKDLITRSFKGTISAATSIFIPRTWNAPRISHPERQLWPRTVRNLMQVFLYVARLPQIIVFLPAFCPLRNNSRNREQWISLDHNFGFNSMYFVSIKTKVLASIEQRWLLKEVEDIVLKFFIITWKTFRFWRKIISDSTIIRVLVQYIIR